jgi:ADP-heptose:LPS heptosyltransferase
VNNIARLLVNAEAVIALDSGIAHYAGMLGCRTVSICSQISPEALFSETDIIGVTPKGIACSPCWFQGSAGHKPACNEHCFAINTITPHDVFNKLFDTIHTQYRFLEGSIKVRQPELA